jgi:hypothetical protein
VNQQRQREDIEPRDNLQVFPSYEFAEKVITLTQKGILKATSIVQN